MRGLLIIRMIVTMGMICMRDISVVVIVGV